MYGENEMWTDAHRLAKLEGGDAAQKQVWNLKIGKNRRSFYVRFCSCGPRALAVKQQSDFSTKITCSVKLLISLLKMGKNSFLVSFIIPKIT